MSKFQLSILAFFSWHAYAVDMSAINAVVFINESTDYIAGDFRQDYHCSDDGYSPRYDLAVPGVFTLPYISSSYGGIYAVDIPDDNSSALFECITLNGNDANDDISFDYDYYRENINIYYKPGSSGWREIVKFTDATNADFCYVYDKDGIDGNDDKYIYPTYENDTLTIHLTDWAPPSNLSECVE